MTYKQEQAIRKRLANHAQPGNTDLGDHAPDDVALLLAALDAARAEHQRVSGVCPTCGGALGVRGCEECIHDSDLRIRAESRLDALLSRLEALEQRYRAEAHVDDSNPRGGLYERIIDDLAALRQEMGQ